MTSDKYKGVTNKPINTVFPNDGYEYDYKYTKKHGWIQVRGKKLSDLPKQKWDIKIPKGKIIRTLKSIKEWIDNKIEDFFEWLSDDIIITTIWITMMIFCIAFAIYSFINFFGLVE